MEKTEYFARFAGYTSIGSTIEEAYKSLEEEYGNVSITEVDFYKAFPIVVEIIYNELPK